METLKQINSVVEKLSILLKQKGLNDRDQPYLIGMICLILKTNPDWNGEDDRIEQAMEDFGFDQGLKNRLLKVDQSGIANVISLIKTQIGGSDYARLINHLWTYFQQYVSRNDKNQVFTPLHISEFIYECFDLDQDQLIYDPTAGIGNLLIPALDRQLQVIANESDPEVATLLKINLALNGNLKQHLISNQSCFTYQPENRAKIGLTLINPPYNANLRGIESALVDKNGADQTKGLFFVDRVANQINQGYLVAIVPLACAIGNNQAIATIKERLLAKHSLEAVFSLPDQLFYPNASVNTCMMIFKLNQPHLEMRQATYFGYYKNDGFKNHKKLGRVDAHQQWNLIKQKWVDYYRQRISAPGFSVLKNVNYDDEWLSEAYMETDYSQLREDDFINTLQEFLAFKIKNPELINKAVLKEIETEGVESDFVMRANEKSASEQQPDSTNNAKPKWKQLKLF